MSSDSENSFEIPEKLSIDPIYKTNWCDMSAEIKRECIGKMEFKERLSLRCTAKAERSLIDSQKIKFHKGEFWAESDDRFDAVLYSENGNKFSKCLDGGPKTLANKAFEFVKYIWKVGVFENLQISFFVPVYEAKLKDYTGEISAKNVYLEYCDADMVLSIIQKLNDDVESIMTNPGLGGLPDIDSDEFLAIPQIQNVPYWHIANYSKTNSLHKVAQMWIDKNSKIGSTFQVYTFDDGSFQEFLEHCKDRIVSKSKKRVRIRTNNPDRHILLERGFVRIEGAPQYFRLMVIHSEMEESKYDNNCKAWIRKIDPEYYNV
ncbi:hypothetical protein B9Z55_012777 [Caenorhabditis nigoni]|uniref:F-box domain-containing protein n=1 Tax=Caenorhabditis nigoni TaxID=1611254 RepID=A0A2G5TYS3_9PELO|nr:hypothetical protein B9Z55_012777 [Caenorhabditis nigoni]